MDLGATLRAGSTEPIAPIGGFDWNLADSLDISHFRLSKHDRKTSQFLRGFSRASSFAGGTRDQLERTLQLSQRAVRALARRVDRLTKENEQLRGAATGRGTIVQERFLCPICLETSKSLVDLDSHVLIRHPDKAARWNELRAPPIPPPDEGDTATREMISDMIGVVNRRFEEMKALIESRRHRKSHRR